jgi:hypothetical protein
MAACTFHAWFCKYDPVDHHAGWLIGWNHHGFEPINFLKFVGFRISRSRHAGQLAVQAEVILEGNGSQRLVFSLDRHAFLGFHSLVQTITPASPGHQAPGELVHNDNFALPAPHSADHGGTDDWPAMQHSDGASSVMLAGRTTSALRESGPSRQKCAPPFHALARSERPGGSFHQS